MFSKVVTYKSVAHYFGLHVNVAKQCLWSFNENLKTVSAVHLVSGRFENGKKVLLVKGGDLDGVLSKIKKLESNHVYSVQSMKGELKEKEVEQEVKKESTVSEKSQSLINQYFKRTQISASTQKEKYSSNKSIDLVQTDLSKFFYKKSTYTYEYHKHLMEADLKGCFEINHGLDDVLSNSQEDVYLYKAAENIDVNAELLEMECQDEASLLVAMKEIENHNSDIMMKFDVLSKCNRESKDNAYPMAKSSDNTQEDQSINFDHESENDLFLYKESVRLEELEKSNDIEAQTIMKSIE